MRGNWWTLCCIIFSWIPIMPAGAVHGCSIFFQPDFKWKKAICDSVQPRLNHIPMDLPNNLVELHVAYQYIPALTNRGLITLVHLETLLIESSNILRVSMDAFHSLTNLKHLSLRNNSLQLGLGGLPKEALMPLSKLETLNLADNPIDLIPDSFFTFPDGNPLHRLFIGPTKGSVLHLGSRCFEGLDQLEFLDLSHSRLSFMPKTMKRSFDIMKKLRAVLLDGNPWHCDCNLRWFYEWLKVIGANGVQFSQDLIGLHTTSQNIGPMCFTPELLYGKSLLSNELKPTDFICPPKLLTESKNMTVHTGKLASFSCEFHADPMIKILWYKDGVLVRNTSRINILHHKLDDLYLSTVQLRSVETTDAGHWRCSLEAQNNIQNAIFYLSVIPSESLLLFGMSATQQSWIFAGFGVGVLFLLLISFGIGIFYCCDPRSNSERWLPRFIAKNNNRGLRTCCGYKMDKTPVLQQESINNQRENTKLNNNKCRKNAKKISPRKGLCAPNIVCFKPIHRASPAESFSQGNGSVLTNVEVNQHDAQIASCASTVSAVLFADRLPNCTQVSSPLTLHGFQNMSMLASSLADQRSRVDNMDLIIHDGIPKNPITSHVYAQLIPVTSIPKSFGPLTVVTKSSSHVINACPVHGSIAIDISNSPANRASISESSSEQQDFLTGSNFDTPSDNTKINPLSRTARHYSRNPPQEDDSSSEHQLPLFSKFHMVSRPNDYSNRISSQLFEKQSTNIAPNLHGTFIRSNVGRQTLGHVPKRSVTIKDTKSIHKSDGSNESVISAGESENEKSWDTTSSSPSSEIRFPQTLFPGASKMNTNYFLPPCGQRFDLHRTHWRGYASQLISPASGSTRSTGHSTSTLPSRIRHKEPHSILKHSSYNYNENSFLRRRSHSQSYSQTLVRPGSKRKLDTDSGTD